MVYANIEYLATDGTWKTLEGLAAASGELLMLVIAGLVNRFGATSTNWRVRIR